jgi:hypothetical protein
VSSNIAIGTIKASRNTAPESPRPGPFGACDRERIASNYAQAWAKGLMVSEPSFVRDLGLWAHASLGSGFEAIVSWAIAIEIAK